MGGELGKNSGLREMERRVCEREKRGRKGRKGMNKGNIARESSGALITHGSVEFPSQSIPLSIISVAMYLVI
tara:strand:- start:666 stop:881 length:216 start_codon:yes stop_codon:yes gene_type:complete